MMAQQQVRKIKQDRCPLCGGTDLSTSQIIYKDGSRQDIPVCQTCAHWIFPDTKYTYLVAGLPTNLRVAIEDILRANLPAEDIKELQVEVVELE